MGTDISIPRGVRRAATILTAAVFCALLGACSGTLPARPDPAPAGTADAASLERAYAASLKAARAAVAPDSLKRKQSMTAQQVRLEWGTLPLGLRPVRPGRAPLLAARGRAGLASPTAISLSLEQLMASEDCHACEARPFHHMVLRASDLHGVAPGLIHAVIQKESAYDPDATSPRKARGLMQITAGTARQMGVPARNLYDPQVNINTGTAYLKYLIGLHDSVEEVLAAYNAGPGNVRKYNGVPPFSETRQYVREVKQLLHTMWVPQ